MKTMSDVSNAASDFCSVEDACRLAGISVICKHGTRIDRCWEGCKMPKKQEAWNGGKLGAALKVGDIIHFPSTKIHRITKLEPYTGPLAPLFTEGAQIATFDTGLGMTIDNSNYYD